MAVLEVGRLTGRASSNASGFRVDFVRDWKQAVSRWNGGGDGATFQHHHWLDAWYGAFEAAFALIAIISDARTRRQVALVPLIRRVPIGIRIFQFAHPRLTASNPPILPSRS